MKDYEELPPIVVDHAKGVFIYDKNGKDYMDIVSSWWCNLLGHCHPEINSAIKKQLDSLEHVIFANFTHTPAIELCEALVKILPTGLSKFNFSDNGSAAIECALKMSFQYQYQTGQKHKKRFMCLSEGYHGETVGALSVGAVDLYSEIYKPMLMDTIKIPAPDCYRCRYGKKRDDCACECIVDAEKSFSEYGEQTAALILEPLLQGAAGMRIYPPLYLKKIRHLCNQYKVLLIADEIATGFGRTGKMFACNHAETSPDIICLSKGLTGGYMPMAITVTTEEIYQAFYADYLEGRAFMHSHTYSGNPLACSAALAVQKILSDNNILHQANENAIYFKKSLHQLFDQHPHIGEIRTIGLVNALELVENKNTKQPFDSKLRTGYQIYKKGLQNGLILRPLGDVLYFNPPLVINKSEIDYAITQCHKSLLEIFPY